MGKEVPPANHHTYIPFPTNSDIFLPCKFYVKFKNLLCFIGTEFGARDAELEKAHTHRTCTIVVQTAHQEQMLRREVPCCSANALRWRLHVSGGTSPENEVDFPQAPIFIVTHPSQLPSSFLDPSGDTQLIVGFDCEGADLCRTGALCVIPPFKDAIYLVDAIEGGELLIQACKPALESNNVIKVVHDCKRDSEALYFQFGIKLQNVMDTQIAYALIEEQEGQKRSPNDYISFVSLLADPRYCGISYHEKQEVRSLLRKDPGFWSYRPLTELMIRGAADDVRFLLFIYDKMMEKLNKRSLWNLSVRGALYCRCFCISDNDFADWPPLPSIPALVDDLVVEALEEEILSVLHVPLGKMGRIIGRRGASIHSIKECCNAEILIGGDKGPPDKIFVIGSVKEVRKAEAIIRGRMLDVW